MPKIPHALEMRSLKYEGSGDAAKDAVAKALMETGRRSEALLLYEGRPQVPFLQEELAWAVEQGVAFHLLALARLGVEIPPTAWTACAKAAEKAARWLDARQCFEALEDEEGLARIADHLPPSVRPSAPPPASD